MIETFKLLSSSLKPPKGTSTSEGLGIADGEMEIIASDLSLLSRVQEAADRMSFTESSYRMGPIRRRHAAVSVYLDPLLLFSLSDSDSDSDTSSTPWDAKPMTILLVKLWSIGKLKGLRQQLAVKLLGYMDGPRPNHKNGTVCFQASFDVGKAVGVWTNYLRPDNKRGRFSPAEEATIIHLHGMLGNRWAHIASQLPGRTDSEIKKLLELPPEEASAHIHWSEWESARVEAEARLSMQSLLVRHTSTVKGHPGIFIQLWNSEVGNKTSASIDTTQEQEDNCKPSADVMSVSDFHRFQRICRFFRYSTETVVGFPRRQWYGIHKRKLPWFWAGLFFLSLLIMWYFDNHADEAANKTCCVVFLCQDEL
ncbi:hypothetical protein DKX38_023220 [Salix brachista]|uniref:Uncharacterized protein n=1 Tax=Salix brachista TaxID=2182728 RepID=A0A5N5K1K1_9ROSI|nr:hypothetical protein DKX38_023220 [Salix brachista]